MEQLDWSNIIPSYDDMLAAGMHYGRKKTVFHPKMKPFVYALRETIHILDLLKTEEKLKEAIEFLKKVKEAGGIMLWASVTKASEAKTVELAKALGMPYVVDRWLGGLLTNFKTIHNRIKYFQEVEQKLTNEQVRLAMLKKERVKLEKEYQEMKKKFDGLRSLTRIPDVVIITSLKEGELPAKEARRVGAKTVAIVNTESDPSAVDYPIPANDNARSSIELLLGTMQKALL